MSFGKFCHQIGGSGESQEKRQNTLQFRVGRKENMTRIEETDSQKIYLEDVCDSTGILIFVFSNAGRTK